MLIFRLGRGSANHYGKNVDLGFLNSILTLTLTRTLTLTGLCRSLNSFKIRIKTLSMICGIPLSLFVIRYDVFWVGIVSALVVSHSQ